MTARAIALVLLGLSAHSLAHGRAPATPATAPPAMQEVTPVTTAEPLNNPGMGIYLDGTLDAGAMPDSAWFAPWARIGYFRDDWAVLAPDAEGRYRFDEYFGPIFDLWVERWHRRVAFRFMSANQHSRRSHVTPKWVFDHGVPSVTLRGLHVAEQITPVFWDERYLAIQERFIADLGRYLDGRPGLEFVDVGAIGEYGEMNLARWTPELLERTGFSRERYVAAYRRLIDAYARAFPRTRVFLCVGDDEAINDYAALRGLHFRQDGLTPAGPSADAGRRCFRPYAPRGVVCNVELRDGYAEMQRKGWSVAKTLDRGLEDPISYLHLNLMGVRALATAPTEVREAASDAARRIGFRFVLTRLRCNQTIHLSGSTPGRLVIEHTWRNEGVAPCYASYALRWTMTDTQGRTVAESLCYPARPTTRWGSGEEIALEDVVRVPSGMPPGEYRLKVAMVEPGTPSLRVQLGIAGRDAEGRHDLCPVRAERRAAAATVVYAEGFEQGVAGWTATAGMTARVHGNAHGGRGALELRGTQPGGAWNYAYVTLRQALLPASRYRLACWMRVDSLAPETPAPYVKLGLSDAAGRWIANVETNRYDLRRRGTWQQLVAYAEATPNTAGGQLAIEKGSLEHRVAAAIRVDDVSLELLESP